MVNSEKTRPNLLRAKISEDKVELTGVPTDQQVEISPELYAELYGIGQAAGAVCAGFQDKIQDECGDGRTAKLVIADLEVEFSVQSTSKSSSLLLLSIDTSTQKRVISCKAKPKIVVV